MEKIRGYLHGQGQVKASDIADFMGLSSFRTRAILSKMDDVEAIGANRSRTYRLKE